jgi:diguanylate cyclase (GGDEF)-like protein
MLVRHYVVISAASIAAVLVLTCLGIYRVSLSRIVAGAEESGLALATSLMSHEVGKMVARAPDGRFELRVDQQNLREVDTAFRSFLHHFGLLRIKVFDRGSRIIYSTDTWLIGREDRNDPGLAKALAGERESEITPKGEDLDFHGTQQFASDVVETYVPVRAPDGKVVGSIELYKDATPYYGEIAPLVAISGALMAAILGCGFLVSYWLLRKEAKELKTAHELLRSQADTDFLSGIFSRRRLLRECEERMARRNGAHGAGSPIAFVMVDIDYFKAINDTFGHAVGDDVIRIVAQRLSRMLRQGDFAGRYGGEEFLIGLPDAGAVSLGAVVERLWASVRSSPVVSGGINIPVTVSLGVASSRPEDGSHEEIIKRADQALYRAKKEGRDTFRFAS